MASLEKIQEDIDSRNQYYEQRKDQKMDSEDEHDRFLYAEWRSYLYKYVFLLSAIIGFSVTLFSTELLAKQIDKHFLLIAYLFIGLGIILGFFAIGYSIYKERKILWGKMMITIAGEYVLNEKKFDELPIKTKSDYRAKKLASGVSSGVRIYPFVFGLLTFFSGMISIIGLYFLAKSLLRIY
jgi:hypothetical protein